MNGEVQRKPPPQMSLDLNTPPKLAASCAKCKRVFTVPGQYRYRGKDGAPICRDERACLKRAEVKSGA